MEWRGEGRRRGFGGVAGLGGFGGVATWRPGDTVERGMVTLVGEGVRSGGSSFTCAVLDSCFPSRTVGVARLSVFMARVGALTSRLLAWGEGGGASRSSLFRYCSSARFGLRFQCKNSVMLPSPSRKNFSFS